MDRAVRVNRPYLVVFNHGLKVADSMMGLPIVIEAGLFVPE